MGGAWIHRVVGTGSGGERAGRPRRAPGDRRAGRDEVPQRVTAHPARLRPRFQGGGAAARRPGEPVRRRAVRIRREPGRRGHRDGAGGRCLVAGHAERSGPARSRGRPPGPQGLVARSGRRAPHRCRPPRLQAGERPGHAGRSVQARRLRDRGGRRHQRRSGGHPLLHGPGAVDRRARLARRRRVRGHGHVLRVPHRPQAVPGRQSRRPRAAARRRARPRRGGPRGGAGPGAARTGQGPAGTAHARRGVRHGPGDRPPTPPTGPTGRNAAAVGSPRWWPCCRCCCPRPAAPRTPPRTPRARC